MPTPVVMPQMGESVAEGTIVRWIKKVGDPVDRDEPLFEISTDKVDAEIPSPVAGVLVEIRGKEGETVPVDSVVGTIGLVGESLVASAEPVSEPRPRPVVKDSDAPATQPAEPTLVSEAAPSRSNGGDRSVPTTRDQLRRQKSSPLVRRIAREHNVDLEQLAGSGLGGRVTKRDMVGYLDRVQGAGRDRGSVEQTVSALPRIPAYRPGDNVEIKPLSVVRRKIAEHMILSRRTSAHVHSVFHVNFSTVEQIRQQKKADCDRAGVKLTYIVFIAKACVEALRRHPIVNASLDGDNVVYKKDINLGIAVALDGGLIVPVIKHADEKNLLGLSRAIVDVAERARAKQLTPEDVHGGTFTITNPGQLGAQFGMPIINQPQVAILGVGVVEKRPVVVDDALGIGTMAYLTLGYDHRLIDGFAADAFMADVKDYIEHFDATQVS